MIRERAVVMLVDVVRPESSALLAEVLVRQAARRDRQSITASSVGLDGFETSTTEAWFRGSLQSSRIDSELTSARLRFGNESALCAPMLPRNGGVNGNCPPS